MIKHIEMWKVSDDKKEEMKQQLDTLKTIPKILHIEVGTKITHLNHLTDPYDIALYSEFGSVEALQEFQKHTKYKEVEKSVERLGHDRKVLDYQAENSISVHELIKLEYEETSEDWRHRDSLTW
jgi:heme-degrading monooxygenase HmoA